MNSLSRREFIGKIGLSAAGVLMLRSDISASPVAKTDDRMRSASHREIAGKFVSPPFECGPWVYWFWLDVNVTHAGITADLEAMKAVGIAGVLIMDVDQGTPASFNGAKFGDAKCYELFKFACSEAHRLGIHINMTNDAGWCGSGGPWVTPELSMQRVVWTSTAFTGGKAIDTMLPQPPANLNFYRDIAVLAFPAPTKAYALPNLNNQTDVTAQDNIPAPAKWPTLQSDQIVAENSVRDISAHMDDTKSGRYECVFTSGKHSTINALDIPKSLPIAGPWRVQFPPGWGAPAEIKLDKLIAWNKHPDAGVRYFSGTAEYQTEFEIPVGLIAADRRIYLDLGEVAVMARLVLNNHTMGIQWKSPFTLDVTANLKPGLNSLRIQVTNLWINRLIGDQLLPEDCDRAPAGNLLKWPQWLLDGKPSPTGRFTFTTWQLWNKNDTLAESGLVGPVKLQIAIVKDIKL